MEDNIWEQSFVSVAIGVRFLGMYFEFWLEQKVFGDDDSEFIERVKEKYKKKFGKRSFYIRPIYYSNTYKVQ